MAVDDESRYASQYDWTGHKVRRRRLGKQAAACFAFTLLLGVSWLML